MGGVDVGWEFRDTALLATAFAGDGPDFQRFEFLGEAVADAVLVRWIYRWSTGTVAVLSGARQQLTSDRTLGRLAALTRLDEVLSPDLQAVPERPGDLIEAVVGAAFLDGGWPAATAVCEKVFAEWLTEGDVVAERAARVDTSVDRDGDTWRWRYAIWVAGASAPLTGQGADDDPVDGEIAALTAALGHLNRSVASVWLEMSDDMRAAMADVELTHRAAAIQTLRALLVPYAGVWFVPTNRIDTTMSPWGSGAGPDGKLSGLECLTGHDFGNDTLERLALCPGPQQRRLAFVGDTILKSASGIAAFTEEPHAHEGRLTRRRGSMLALDRLHRAALDVGLAELLLPGEQPADPVRVIRAALGALAVDGGVERAVDVASRWIRDVRVDGTLTSDLCFVRCSYDTSGPLVVHVELATPRQIADWQLHDQTVIPVVRGIEGICAAIDSLSPDDRARPLLIEAPTRIVDAVNDPARLREESRHAVDGLMQRIDQHGLKVAWAYRPA